MTVTTSTRPDALRSGTKPTSARRLAIRESLPGDCMTCGEAVCFSSETPDSAPHKGTFGHVLALCAGGTWEAGNVGTQCWTCNLDAKRAAQAGLVSWDLSADVIAGSIPTRYLPTKVAQRGDRRTAAPLVGMATEAQRREARNARGLVW